MTPFFGRRSRSQDQGDEFEHERTALLRSIQNRGQADVQGAAVLVDSYVQGVLARAQVEPRQDVLDWARDQMRFFIVVGWIGWFRILEDFPQELASLQSEYRALVDHEEQFGPEHLIAWWWLLQPSLFRPLVDRQLVEMQGTLVDQARLIVKTGGNFLANKKDWKSLRAGWGA